MSNSRGAAADWTGNGTFSGPVTLAGNSPYANGGTLAISGNIGQSTPSGLTLMVGSNGGVITLSGTNTYTGPTNITGGTLNASAYQALGSGGLVTVSGGLLNASAGQRLTGGNSLTVSGGTANLTAANNYTGTTTLSSGVLLIGNPWAIGSGSLVLNGGTFDNTSGGSLTLAAGNAQNWGGKFTYAGSMQNMDLGNGAVTLDGCRHGQRDEQHPRG